MKILIDNKPIRILSEDGGTIGEKVSQIESSIFKDNARQVQIYQRRREFLTSWFDNSVTLDVFTKNLANNESFLMTTQTGDNLEDALVKVHQWVLSLFNDNKQNSKSINGENVYTVEWMKKSLFEGTKLDRSNRDENKIRVSYFYASDMYHLLNKFYNGKKIEDYVIFSIKLSPIS